jgi:AraC family transcriptional regulator
MSTSAIVSAPRGASFPPAALRIAPPSKSFAARPVGAAEARASLLSRLLEDAFEAFDQDRDVARISLSRAVALLTAEQASPAVRAKAADLGALAPWQAKKAVAHIDSHLDSPIRIGELAALARLSTSYFSRAFKATFGRSPQQFILDRRIAHAQHVMLSSDEPLCGVALACGFSDQAHMSRIFRRLVGNSPNAWRRARRMAPMAL